MRRVPEALRAILEQLRIQPKDERGVDAGAALAADLGRQVVQRVQVIVDDIEVTLGDVFPFVLEGMMLAILRPANSSEEKRIRRREHSQ